MILISLCESHWVVSNSLQAHGLYSPWNSPGQNTGVGSFSLLHGIFPTQGSNPDLPHCRQIFYQLSHKGSPRRLECIAHPFSSESSQPRNRTGVSCIAGGFFINWAIREAQKLAWLTTALKKKTHREGKRDNGSARSDESPGCQGFRHLHLPLCAVHPQHDPPFWSSHCLSHHPGGF